ncbi:MAG: T9SS type A sorting domain-containing protein [Salinivirgaceae bacterium]|jgi:hypothetical protein|nr:T9SS type A sorting domain-containing protein [Salinivirgaceae bacterium]
MKKQLLKIGAACLALAVSANVMAQEGEATVLNLGDLEIVLDGVADDAAWGGAEQMDLELIFQEETPTVTAYWKAAWNDDGMYAVCVGEDDVWMPSWLSGVDDWQSDKVEFYYDTTDPQDDGGGASAGAGNYQVGANFTETDPGTEMPYAGSTFAETPGVITADTYDGDGNYVVEVFVPWSVIPTNTETVIDPYVTTIIGFDVVICDRDAAADGVRNRKVWSNVGGTDESWNNCDDVGLITFDQTEISVSSVKSDVSNVNVLVSNVVTNNLELAVKASEIKVLNSIGQVVGTSVNVSDLNKGIYIAVIKTDNGNYSSKFLKK